MNKKISKLLQSSIEEDRKLGLNYLKKYKGFFRFLLAIEWVFSVVFLPSFLPWAITHFDHHWETKYTRFTCFVEYWIFLNYCKPKTYYLGINVTKSGSDIDRYRALKVDEGVVFYLTPIGNFLAWLRILRFNKKSKYLHLVDKEISEYL